MHFRAIPAFLLIAIYCGCGCSAVSVLGKGRVPITSPMPESNTTAPSISLPNGFKPQSAPMNPLLYPFVTESSSATGWKPIINGITSVQTSATFTPPQVDRISTVTESAYSEEGPLFESVVYGTWKPDPPLEPNKMFDYTHLHNSNGEIQVSGGLDTIISDRNEQLFESIGQKHEITETTPINTQNSFERQQQIAHFKVQLNAQYDKAEQPFILHHKLTTERRAQTTERNTHNSPESPYLQVVNVNNSDAKLLAIAKQINDSAENIPFPKREKPTTNTRSTWATFKPTEGTKDYAESTEKVWPTDFMISPVMMRPTLPTVQKPKYSFIGDSSEPPLALNGLNKIPESLLPQVPFNITKVGIPYENQNSAEEPTICVPLTVYEKLDTDESVEVDRVYCFPLPPPEVETAPVSFPKSKLNTINENKVVRSRGNKIENRLLILLVSSLSWMLCFK